MKKRKNKKGPIFGHAGKSMNETSFRNMAAAHGHGFVKGDLNTMKCFPYMGQGYAKSGRPRIGKRLKFY